MLVSFYQKVQLEISNSTAGQQAKAQLLTHAQLAYNFTQVSARPMVHAFKHQMLVSLLSSSDSNEYSESLQLEMERTWQQVVNNLVKQKPAKAMFSSKFEDSLEPYVLYTTQPCLVKTAIAV